MMVGNRPVERIDVAGACALFADSNEWEPLDSRPDGPVAAPARIVRSGAGTIRRGLLTGAPPLETRLDRAGVPATRVAAVGALVRNVAGDPRKAAAFSKELATLLMSGGVPLDKLAGIVDVAISEIESAAESDDDRAAGVPAQRARLAGPRASQPAPAGARLPIRTQRPGGVVRARGRVDLARLSRAKP